MLKGMENSKSKCGTHVVVRSTLASGEDGGVDSRLEVGLLVLSEKDETSSGTSKGLVAAGNKVDPMKPHIYQLHERLGM